MYTDVSIPHQSIYLFLHLTNAYIHISKRHPVTITKDTTLILSTHTYIYRPSNRPASPQQFTPTAALRTTCGSRSPSPSLPRKRPRNKALCPRARRRRPSARSPLTQAPKSRPSFCQSQYTTRRLQQTPRENAHLQEK